MTTAKDRRSCTQAELHAYLKAYPRPLDRDVNGTCEPPAVTFNDFTLGDWPDSIVASHCLGDETEAEHGWRILEPVPAQIVIGLDDWAVILPKVTDRYTAPELIVPIIDGVITSNPPARSKLGARIGTAALDRAGSMKLRADGHKRRIRTIDGRQYELGAPEPGFVEFCKQSGCHVPTDDEPMLFEKSTLPVGSRRTIKEGYILTGSGSMTAGSYEKGTFTITGNKAGPGKVWVDFGGPGGMFEVYVKDVLERTESAQ